MTAASTDPIVGRLIDGRYQVRSRIARGGMATVYLATDLRLERRVALKVMHGHLADDEQFRERFIQEARSAARLAHPNVVNVFDQGQDDDMAYLVMEFLPGITLRDLLLEHGHLTPEQTVDIAEAVLSGLAAAHRAGILHRDLKPENVLLADDGRIKIGDFGLARASSANTATGAALMGTVAYLSPELVTRGAADARSDIYAVGIMMYEMLTGEQPFIGAEPMHVAFQHANEKVPAPSLKNPDVPHELDELVLWATARDPEDRPRDARALLEELRASQIGPPSPAQPTARLSPSTTSNPTAVLPVVQRLAADAETQIIAPQRDAARNGGTRAADALAVRSQRRSRRGAWIFLIVAVLTAVAAATGWWFAAGPGSQVVIPEQLSGMTVEQARGVLTELGLSVSEATGEMSDPVVAVGLVAGTDPELGARVNRGDSIVLLLSTGPQQLAIPDFLGRPEGDVKNDMAGSFEVAESSIQQFSADVAQGLVIDALDGDGVSLSGRETYAEGQQVRLVVSVGPIPEVAGLTIDDAIDTLAEVGLVAQSSDLAEFSDTIAEGLVLGVTAQTEGPVRPNDTVLLVLSKGVEQVVVPDVEDFTLSEARAELEAAGFSVDYNIIFDALDPEFVRVKSTNPRGGELADKGSTIRLTLSATG